METDWTGPLYIRITLQWNYQEGYVDISMPKYVQKNLVKYKYKKPKYPQEPAPRKYGKAAAEDFDKGESPVVGEADKKYIQQVLGSFCTMHELLTSPFFKPSTPLQLNKQIQPNVPSKECINSWTTWQPIQMPS